MLLNKTNKENNEREVKMAILKHLKLLVFILCMLGNTYKTNGQECAELDRTVEASPSEICLGDYGVINIPNSENNVYYQAYDGNKPVSGIGYGNGGNIKLYVPASQLSTIGSHQFQIAAIKNPVEPGQFAIFEKQNDITIDGTLSEDDWLLTGRHPYEAWGTPPSQQEGNSQFAGLFDDTYLYLSVRVQDASDPFVPVKDVKKLHQNDAVEFIIGPPGKNRKYIITAEGDISRGDIPFNKPSLITPPSSEIEFASHIDYDKNTWSAELRIKWEELGYTSNPVAGETFKFDSYIDFAQPVTTADSIQGQRYWNNNQSYNGIGLAGDAVLVGQYICNKIMDDKPTFNVNGLPDAEADANPKKICGGEDFNLIGGPDVSGYSYRWNGPGYSSNDRNPVVNNTDISMAGLYTLTVRDGNGCENTDTVSISITETARINITNPNPACRVDLTDSIITQGTKAGPDVFQIPKTELTVESNMTWNGGRKTEPAYDGDTSTYFFALPRTHKGDNFITIDLGEAKNLVKIDILTGDSTLTTTNATVYYKESESDTYVSSGISFSTSAKTYATIDLSRTSAQFIKIQLDPGFEDKDNWEIKEIDIYISEGNQFTYWRDDNATQELTKPDSVTESGTYYIKLGNGPCSDIKPVEVTIAQPTVDAGSDAGGCGSIGKDVNLYAEGISGSGATWQWSGPEEFTSVEQNPVIPNMSTDKTGIYSVTATDAGGCLATDTVEINVGSPPSAYAGEDKTITSNTSIQLDEATASDGSGNYDIRWTPVNKLEDASVLTPVTINLTEETTFTLRVTDEESGCYDTDQVTVFIAIGEPPTIVCPEDTLFYMSEGEPCEKEISLNEPLASDDNSEPSISWEISGSITDSGEGIIDSKLFPVGEKALIRYTATDIDGNKARCEFSVQIIDTIAPTLICAEPRDLIDVGCSYTIEGNEFDLQSYSDTCGIDRISYELRGATNEPEKSGTTLAGKVLWPDDNKTTNIIWHAYDIWDNESTCTTEVKVTGESFEIEAIPSAVSCFGMSDGRVEAYPLDPTSNNLSYSLIDFSSDTSYYSDNGIWNNLPTGTYIAQIEDKDIGCSGRDPATVSQPVKKLTFDQVYINHVECYDSADGSVELIADGGNSGYEYFIEGQKLTGNTVDTLRVGKWKFSVLDSKNCTDSIEIEILQPEKITLNIPPESIQKPLCPSSRNGRFYVDVEGGSPNYMYIWSDGIMENGYLTNLRQGEHTVKVVDNKGCYIDTTISLYAINNECLRIPTAFTPNNDEINDTWEITSRLDNNMSVFDIYPNLKILIYNRIGEKVWESVDGARGYDNNWDGKDLNGNDLPIDSYYFIMKLNDHTNEVVQGIVTIVL